MKYHNHIIQKAIDADVIGGKYYNIYRIDFIPKEFDLIPHLKYITNALVIPNAKEFIDTYDGHGYNYNVLG